MGLYGQSKGQQCNHNTIDGPAATAFVVDCIRQRLLQPHLFTKLTTRLRELADTEANQGASESEDARQLESQLVSVEREVSAVQQNLARATSDAQFQAISAVFDELKEKQESLQRQLDSICVQSASTDDSAAEVEKALLGLQTLAMTEDDHDGDFSNARRLIEAANAKIFPRFSRVKEGKRTLNKLTGGVVTLGAAEPPIKPYDGTTGRGTLQKTGEDSAEQIGAEACCSGVEGNSLRNVSRGD